MKELDFIRMARGEEGVRKELFKVAVIFIVAFMMGCFSVWMSPKMITGRLTGLERQKVIESKEDNVLIFAEGGGIIRVENISLRQEQE